MKKIVAIILTMCVCLTMCAVFVGCADKNQTESNAPIDVAEQVDFKALENYASVVRVKIDPTVDLYLDENGTVLAVNYVNEDAKDSYTKIEDKLVGSSLNESVSLIVETAAKDGYFDKDNDVNIILRKNTSDSSDEILEIANTAAKATLEEKNIDAKVNIDVNLVEETTSDGSDKDSSNVVTLPVEPTEKEEVTNSETTSSKETSSVTASSKTEDTSSKKETTSSKASSTSSKKETSSKTESSKTNLTSSKKDEIPTIVLNKKTTYHGFPVVFFIGDDFDFEREHTLEEFGLGSNSDSISIYCSEYYDSNTKQPIRIFANQKDTFLDNGKGLQDILANVGAARNPAKIKK